MSTSEDYKEMVKFFQERTFEVHECIYINDFSRLELLNYKVFKKFLDDGLGEILPFSSPLGDFYLHKVGPKYGDWKTLKLSYDC